MRTGRCAKRPARYLSPRGRGPRGFRGGRTRRPPPRPAAHGIRPGSPPPRADTCRGSATPPGSGTYEALDLALEIQLGAFALEQRLEFLVVRDAFINLHVG